MKNTFRLKVVQDLAQQHSDTAAIAARGAQRRGREGRAEAQHADRRTARTTASAFAARCNQDVHSAGWKNFQQFLVKLDEAIEQQRGGVRDDAAGGARGQRDWQSKQVKVKAFDTLEQRHHAAGRSSG